ncbi:MAG: c-type cytochrome [Pseudomonadota bacterium]
MQRHPSSFAPQTTVASAPRWVIGWALACLALTGTAHAARPQGDASRGQTLYSQQCMACHAADISLAGPLHRGVVGRKSASVPDYPYSPALQRLKLTWTERTLDTWLRDPNRMAPGNRMGFAVSSAQDRLDLIAYLKTLQPQAATGSSKP